MFDFSITSHFQWQAPVPSIAMGYVAPQTLSWILGVVPGGGRKGWDREGKGSPQIAATAMTSACHSPFEAAEGADFPKLDPDRGQN